jgi:hypothetical protein
MNEAGLCNAYFHPLMLEFNRLFAHVGEEEVVCSDPYERLGQIIRVIANHQTLYRFLAMRMGYLKAHAAHLRHGNEVNNKGRIKAIEYLGDIIVNLELLASYQKVDTEACGCQARTFYSEYHDWLRIKLKVPNLPPKELFQVIAVPSEWVGSSTVPLVEPALEEVPIIPSGQTIAWYKENGFREMLRDRIFTPTFGSFRGRSCQLLRFNGTRTLIKTCDTDEVRSVGNTTVLNWL